MPERHKNSQGGRVYLTLRLDEYSHSEDGDTDVWQAGTLDRSLLDRRGWKYDHLVAGDDVVLTGRLAFDGSNRLQLLTIVRPSDGWECVGYGAN